MRKIGFSTGALALGDFRRALQMLAPHHLPCVELSALRVHEVTPLLEGLSQLDLSGYSYVSFHAPGKFLLEDEQWLSNVLFEKVPETWPIVMHPDAIFDFGCWRRFGSRLAIENMDRRKPCGRTVQELEAFFEQLPEASLCFDIGHARQFDASMTEAFLILTKFRNRLRQIHVSEVNSESHHDTISYGAIIAFQQVADLFADDVAVIIESRVGEGDIVAEVRRAEEALITGLARSKSMEIRGLIGGLDQLMKALSGLNAKAAS